MKYVVGLYNYWVVIFLMMAGLYVVIAQGNLLKKIVGLSLFQTSVFILYISMGKVDDGHVPIFSPGVSVYSNPLPHVLILTAIVVGVATTAVGLALVVRIREAYGTVEEDEIQAMNAEDCEHESACGQRQGEDCAPVSPGEGARIPLESAAPSSGKFQSLAGLPHRQGRGAKSAFRVD